MPQDRLLRIPLDKLELADNPKEEEAAWRKINRYLDVTKSALLFGGRVILVEGIAEALLLPLFARKLWWKDDAEEERTKKYRLFRAAVVVPIDGVDFEPYIRLLLTPHQGIRIADRVVVMTDGDKHTNNEDGKSGANRKQRLDSIAAACRAGRTPFVKLNDYSLETELVRAGNRDIMKKAYLDLHPRKGATWDEAALLAKQILTHKPSSSRSCSPIRRLQKVTLLSSLQRKYVR